MEIDGVITQIQCDGDQKDLFSIIFKFGGDLVKVKNQDRKRYNGGKQRTLKIEKKLISFLLLKAKIEIICPWLKGHEFDIHYHIFGTSPKDYKIITSDVEVREMIEQSNEIKRAEVIVVIHDRVQDGVNFNSGLLISQFEIEESLFVGKRFADAKNFKFTLKSDAIKHNFGLKIVASDRKRVIATCAYRDCPWRIRASICADDISFEVTRIDGTHNCPGVNRAGNKLATSDWVANEIQDMVKKNPDVSPKQINNTLEMSFGLSLPYMKLWRGREHARELVFGSADDSYHWVPTLRAELLKRNQGSHITYTIEHPYNSFQRFFVSFKVCIDGFLVGCRHLVGLDACHLKSKYLGVLLSATTLDGNNKLYTLAFAAVETESKKTWQWFLENLYVALAFELYPLAFISDMEKGLAEAVKVVFPNAEHRVCMRHLWKNMKKDLRFQEGHMIQNMVWSAANEYLKHEFEQKLNELSNVSPKVHAYLLSLNYNWSKSQFTEAIKNDSNTNNMSESFNAWISEARSKPVVELVDLIRGKLMERRVARKLNSMTWRGELVPYAEEYIRDIITRRDQFIVRQSSMYTAEVEGRNKRHEVDIDTRVCTCRYWQMTGLPCIHAVAFIGMKEHPLWNIYVDEHYHVFRYRMAYEGTIATLPDKSQWNIVDDGMQVGVPNTSRPRGRPRKRRLRNFLETDKKVHKCSRCLSWGHHKSTCKNPISQNQSTSECNISSLRSKLPIRKESMDEGVPDAEQIVDISPF